MQDLSEIKIKDIGTLNAIKSDINRMIDETLRDVAEQTANELVKKPLYEISDSEIRIYVYENVKEMLEDYTNYLDTIEELLLCDMEQSANRPQIEGKNKFAYGFGVMLND